MRAKDRVGRGGEELAARYLLGAGYAVLDRNWRCDLGEIDIVARDGRTLVICEVKTRTGTGYGTPVEAVTPRKAGRLRRLAGRWLDEHPGVRSPVRIDVIGILALPGQAPRIEHLREVS